MDADFQLRQSREKKLIEKYFYQLTVGCGSPSCQNENCFSSGKIKNYSPNQLAIKAIKLYTEDAKFCAGNLIEALQLTSSELASGIFGSENNCDVSPPSSATISHNSDKNSNIQLCSLEFSHIDEDLLSDLMHTCDLSNNYSKLIRTLGFVFSKRESVVKSFQQKPKSSVDIILEKVNQQPCALKLMKKEEIRTLEGDEKDEDCMIEEAAPSVMSIDYQSLRRCMRKLNDKNPQAFQVLDSILEILATELQIEMCLMKKSVEFEEVVACIVISFEIFQIDSKIFEKSIVRMISVAANLPVTVQISLARTWSVNCVDNLQSMIHIVQDVITQEVLANSYHQEFFANDDETIRNATNVMKTLFCVNFLVSKKVDPMKYVTETVEDIEDKYDYSSIIYRPDQYSSSKYTFEDPLFSQLDISINDIKEPFIPFEDFQNELLCSVIDTTEDYKRFRIYLADKSSKTFSFICNSFIMTSTAKALALFIDSQFNKMRSNLDFSPNPYLKLKVRRDYIIDDALTELELIAMVNPRDLKKQLFVEFDGEQGIDEGGLSKEFFQLIIEEIFNPDYGMFALNNDSQTYWFNPFSFENEGQFSLIGIVLGLAIYNNIILPLNLPMVVFKKLLNVKITWHDLKDLNPVIYSSLKSIVDYSDSDFEDVFSQTFEIGYENLFGSPMRHCLKKDGDKISVNQHNKQEFVELYGDFLLNKSIEKQFEAFQKGFQMVTDESPLHLLFRPEEVELLVCGTKNIDFDEMERLAEYESGYSKDSRIIKDFWSIVHELSLDSKRKLFQFITGSTRAPVGKLRTFKLIIARHGPDCDRLPTSHTCFNILLLPEYNSQEKLKERLLKAINYSIGFGML